MPLQSERINQAAVQSYQWALQANRPDVTLHLRNKYPKLRLDFDLVVMRHAEALYNQRNSAILALGMRAMLLLAGVFILTLII